MHSISLLVRYKKTLIWLILTHQEAVGSGTNDDASCTGSFGIGTIILCALCRIKSMKYAQVNTTISNFQKNSSDPTSFQLLLYTSPRLVFWEGVQRHRRIGVAPDAVITSLSIVSLYHSVASRCVSCGLLSWVYTRSWDTVGYGSVLEVVWNLQDTNRCSSCTSPHSLFFNLLCSAWFQKGSSLRIKAYCRSSMRPILLVPFLCRAIWILHFE